MTKGQKAPFTANIFCKPWFFCASLAGAAVLLCLPALFVGEILKHDVSGVYAPMVRELAAGNWERAFFMKSAPLPILAAALIAKAGLAPHNALKLTSTLFFALGVIPVFLLSRRIFGERTARWAALLYVVCPRIARLGMSGLRDSAKVTFFVITVYALLRFADRRDWSSTILVTLGCAGMALTRGESVAFSLIALCILGLLDLSRSGSNGRCFKMPRKFFIGFTLTVILMFPWMYYLHTQTGFYVTDSRQAILIEKLMDTLRPNTPGDKGNQ